MNTSSITLSQINRTEKRRHSDLPFSFVRIVSACIGSAACLAFLAATPAATAEDPTITRTIPEFVQRGDPFTVTLLVHPTGLRGEWNVTEQVPAGFIAQNINQDGRFIPGDRQVHWGPFTTNQEQSLEFQLVPSQLALGTKVIQFGGPEAGLFTDTAASPFPISGPDTVTTTKRVRPQEARATRVINESPRLGETFTVTIHAAPGTSGPWGLTEQIPHGFTADNISNGGRLAPSTRQIHWGMFSDTNEKDLSYRLVPAQLSLGTSVVQIGGPNAVLTDDPILTPFRITGVESIHLDGQVFFPRGHSTDETALPKLEPNVVVQPEDRTVRLGETAEFRVGATGNQPLSYQWFHKGKPIPGATASRRLIRDVSRADRGIVFVVVTDAAGNSTVSRPALLHVIAPDDPHPGPTITTQPKDKRVNIQNTTTFYVAAKGASPLSFQWFRNGMAIDGATSPKLVLRHISRLDDGVYHAQVTDGAGRVTLTYAVVLEVIIPKPFAVSTADQKHLPSLFNLAGSYRETIRHHETKTKVRYRLVHNQYGRLTGNGTLSFKTPEGEFSTDNLEVHGYIRRIGPPDDPIDRVHLILRASQESSFNIVLTQVMEVDAAGERLVGHIRGKAHVGDHTYSLEQVGHQIPLPSGRDGSWTLHITPPVDGEIEGKATLHIQGDELTYEVNRLHLYVQDVEVYHLRGVGMDSSGSNLRVDFDPLKNVSRIFGQAKGQRLNATPDH